MTESPSPWRATLTVAIPVFVVAAAGCAIAFWLWLQDITAPQIAILGSGNRLSILVADGPARLVLATGDDEIAYENSLARFQPLFARRIDVLLLAGDGTMLRVPRAAHDDHPRATLAVAPLLPSLESAAIGPVSALTGPRRIRLGPNVDVTIEAIQPYGTLPSETFPSWRVTITRGDTRVVVLSDGNAADQFPPAPPASVLVVSGDNPATAWEQNPAVALIVNARSIEGPELREAFAGDAAGPNWSARVSDGESLRLRFVEDGIAMPSDAVQALSAIPESVP